MKNEENNQNKQKKQRILNLFLALAIAFGLWLYVITVEHTGIEYTFYNVPVILDGESILRERGLMIVSDTDLTVNLRVSGNRSSVNSLKNSDITVLADLTRIYEAGEKQLNFDVRFPGSVQDGAIEVVNRDPDSIKLTVVEWTSKEIPVELAYSGRVPDGYYVDKQNAKVETTAVTVTGPKELINQIGVAKITVDLTAKSETVVENLRYSLCDAEGIPINDVSSVTTDQGDIRVTVPIHKVKNVNLALTVIPGGGLTEEDVTITLDYDSITVAGTTAKLAELGDAINLGTIDLSAVTESGKMTFAIKLPEGVTNQSGITEVTADIKVPELEIRAYNVTNFRVENVPAGLNAQVITRMLNVKVRGVAPVLDKLTAADIVVVVDFSKAEVGSASYAVSIEIEGFETVGAVETYYVTANVTENTQSAEAQS